MHSEDIVDRLAAEFSARYAGAMYRATLYNGAEVSRRITEWRLKRRQKKGTTTKSSGKRYGDTSFEEVALEAKRQELLKSEDAEERKQGEAMVTPTSIWLADQDPKAFRSARLALLGESKDKQSADRETKTMDEALGDEVDAITTTESTIDVVEDEAQDLAKDPQSGGVAKKKAPSRLGHEKSTIQVWIPLSFPPVPQKGGWDVSRLRESKYFFS
jgi:DNA-directed RNA polymerase